MNREDETSTLNLDEETSEISHELEFIYFGESDDDDGDNLSDSDYDDYIYHHVIISHVKYSIIFKVCVR